MLRCPRWIPIAVLVLAGAVAVVAAAQTVTTPPDSVAVVSDPETADVRMAVPTPLDREVAAIRDSFRSRLADLTARYGATPDAGAAAGIQREIAALKMQLEIDLLDLQLRLARERSDADAIAELEQSLTAARARLVADTGLEAPAAPAGGAKR